jgi:hypothetical protein
MWWWPAPIPDITREQCLDLSEDLTVEEISAALGCPPGNYLPWWAETGGFESLTEHPEAFTADPAARWHLWDTRRCVFAVLVDGRGRRLEAMVFGKGDRLRLHPRLAQLLDRVGLRGVFP